LAKAGNNCTISAIAFCVVKGLVCFANEGFRMPERWVWNDAKSTFLQAFRNLTQSQPSAEGIVVVFDSADDGQIAPLYPA